MATTTVNQDLELQFCPMNNSHAVPETTNTTRLLFRYAVVGIISNTSGYIVYLVLTYFGTTPKITMTFLYLISATLSFFGNRNLTFSHKGTLLGSGFRYIIAHIFGYILNFAILTLFVDRLGYAHQIVQAIAILVVAAFLFTTFKLFVFRPTNAES
jgi:putative flippase GtrA